MTSIEWVFSPIFHDSPIEILFYIHARYSKLFYHSRPLYMDIESGHFVVMHKAVQLIAVIDTWYMQLKSHVLFLC